MRELNAILTIAFRDWVKFLRDRTRIVASLVFPIIFVGALGGSLKANLGDVGFDFMTFVFTGILAQTMFQSTALGVIYLIEDRENDFSQEIFVSPISRYSIILGKILGESLVAFSQVVGVFLFGLIIGVSITLAQIAALIPALFIASFLGGAFGVLVMSNISSQRTAAQIFPFVIFPQFVLAGVFSPIQNLPLPLFILSRIAPMTYAVDFIRNVYYAGSIELPKIVVYNFWTDIVIIAALFGAFLLIGTFFFVKNERNR